MGDTTHTTQDARPANAGMRDRLVAARVRRGFNEQDSAALLDEILRTVSPQNLPSALAYQGFTR